MFNLFSRPPKLIPEKVDKRKRASIWPYFLKVLINKRGNKCECCGRTANLEGHHKIPFHIDPSLELTESNVIVLCMGPLSCHYIVGHCGVGWDVWNSNVDEDVKLMKQVLEIIKKHETTNL